VYKQEEQTISNRRNSVLLEEYTFWYCGSGVFQNAFGLMLFEVLFYGFETLTSKTLKSIQNSISFGAISDEKHFVFT